MAALGRIALGALIVVGALGAAADEIARGDSSWERRAAGEQAGRPLPGPILEAASAYESAIRSNPGDLEARWKLLRALHFAGDFVVRDAQERRGFFERARDVSEEGLALLASRVASAERLDEMDAAVFRARLESLDLATADVARLYFWSAINWAAWSREAGLLGAVRQGVANRLYRYTSTAIALESGYEEGGAFRLLGSLHAQLPRVPFLSGWVDRDQSLPLIQRAIELAPENPGNRLLLALALLELAPEREPEAVGLLEGLEVLTPRADMRIEDLAMRRQARDRLAAWRAGDRA